MKSPLYCSFCGKRDCDVDTLIAGPTVLICDECVDLCSQIVADNRQKKLTPADLEYLSWEAVA